MTVTIPPWSIRAGALASWLAFNLTRGTGTVAGMGLEIFGSVASVAVTPLSPLVGTACQLAVQGAKRQLVDASEMTAIVAGAAAAVSVTSACVVGNWIFEEAPGAIDLLIKMRTQRDTAIVDTSGESFVMIEDGSDDVKQSSDSIEEEYNEGGGTQSTSSRL
jgi:hypothetical protein